MIALLTVRSFTHESKCAGSICDFTVLSKGKDFLRSEAFMYTSDVVISRKQCKIETLFLQATNGDVI